jgi:hypothetical protein
MPSKSKSKSKSKKTTQKVTQKQTNKQVVQVAVGDANFSRFRPQNLRHIQPRGAFMGSPSGFPFSYSSTTIVNPSAAPPINNNNIDVIGLTNRQNALEQAQKNYERELSEATILTRLNRDTISSLTTSGVSSTSGISPPPPSAASMSTTVLHPTQGNAQPNTEKSPTEAMSVVQPSVKVKEEPLRVTSEPMNQPNHSGYDAERMFSYLNGMTTNPPSRTQSHKSDEIVPYSDKSSSDGGVKIVPEGMLHDRLALQGKRDRPSSLASSRQSLSSGIPSMNGSIKNKNPPPSPPPSGKGARASPSLSRQSSHGSASTGFDDPFNNVRGIPHVPRVPSSHGTLNSSRRSSTSRA